MGDPIIRILFIGQLASSLYMVGLIWFVQIVHYPLFDSVHRDSFTSYEQRHTALTTWVVGPPMLVEGVSALLLTWLSPSNISGWSHWVGLFLLGVIWLSTAVVQIPCHKILSERFDPMIQQRLVWTNWLRTLGWSLRGILMLWMVWSSLG